MLFFIKLVQVIEKVRVVYLGLVFIEVYYIL